MIEFYDYEFIYIFFLCKMSKDCDMWIHSCQQLIFSSKIKAYFMIVLFLRLICYNKVTSACRKLCMFLK